MGKLIVVENMTIDGVVEDPTGEEGFRLGGWSDQISDTDRQAWVEYWHNLALGTEAQLLGRRTYEFLVPRFSTPTSAWGERLTEMPKYVVSSTLADPRWNNTTVLRGDIAVEISQLKQRLDGDIYVSASGTLVPALIDHRLVDEIQLIVCPHALGEGKRVLSGITDAVAVQLKDAKVIGDNLAVLTYTLSSRTE